MIILVVLYPNPLETCGQLQSVVNTSLAQCHVIAPASICCALDKANKLLLYIFWQNRVWTGSLFGNKFPVRSTGSIFPELKQWLIVCLGQSAEACNQCKASSKHVVVFFTYTKIK